MHCSSLCSKILIIKGNIWTNRPVHGLLACYKRSYRILLFFHPEMVLADGWTTIETPQPWCQKEGRPHHPTWTPHPSLFELKETTFFVHESHRDDSSPSHYASRFTCFLLVSSSGSFPKYVPWFCDHYPSLMIILMYICFCLQKCQSIFLIWRYSGL